MGPVDITAIGVWNYQIARSREAYHAHMYYLDSVAKKTKPRSVKKDFTEPKKVRCDWPGCPVRTRSTTGFCTKHRSTKSRKPRAA